MTVQAGLCGTWSEPQIVVFSDAKVQMIFRAAPGSKRLRALFLNHYVDHLRAVSGVGSSPALATCETSQVLLAGVPGGFSQGSSLFCPTYRLARLT